MSKQSKKVWVFQSPDKYFNVVPIFLDALRGTGYFDKFYMITNKSISTENLQDCVCIWRACDYGWSNNIIAALEHVEEDIFFMGCEDHIVVDFNQEIIDRCFEAIKTNPDIGCIRLTRKPKIKLKGHGRFAPIKKPYAYYVSLQPTIWKKTYLKEILVPDESAWEFERNASKRAMAIENPKAGCVSRTVFNYQNFMKRGGLFRPGYIKFAQEHNIPLDSEKFYEEWKLNSGKYDFESIHNS